MSESDADSVDAGLRPVEGEGSEKGRPVSLVYNPEITVGDKKYSFESVEEMERHIRLLEKIHKNHERYSHLPYVWGGNSPSYLLALAKCLAGKTQTGNEWREGHPIMPGFDCSGWVQYNFKRGYLYLPKRKVGCRALREHSAGQTILGEGTYTSADLAEASRPGDLLFLSRDGCEHVGIVLGNGFLSECAGRKMPDFSISDAEWKIWREYAQPEEHGKNNWDRGGVQISPLAKYLVDGPVELKRYSRN